MERRQAARSVLAKKYGVPLNESANQVDACEINGADEVDLCTRGLKLVGHLHVTVVSGHLQRRVVVPNLRGEQPRILTNQIYSLNGIARAYASAQQLFQLGHLVSARSIIRYQTGLETCSTRKTSRPSGATMPSRVQSPPIHREGAVYP